ncbi:DUF192 domain-containing protein [Marinicella meishanensis]|uniref:DUF192 domain-containing protein n=1 Tax=Marinicella meishanensis TaxID=2873263 RepID=UPI001CBB63EB|nr:DUF192 domain-containing protein [Marinicella sp. NBU2979]
MKKNALLGLLILLLCGCQPAQNRVTLKGQTFDVEVANDNQSRAMGLMFRENMASDAGMLFIFPQPQPLAFWMKNTLIPLDILYFDQNRKLINISERTPPCKNTTTRCPNYPSVRPAKYVLEINAGLSEQYGFQPGDELIIELKN